MDFTKSVIKTDDVDFFKFEQDSDYFSIVSRETALLTRCFFPLGICSNDYYQEYFGFDSNHRPIYDFNRGIYLDKNKTKIEQQEILSKADGDNDYLHRVVDKCEKAGFECLEFSKLIKGTDWNSKDEEEIKKHLEKLFEHLVRMSSFLIFPLSIQKYLEDVIKSELAKKFTEQNKQEEYFIILTSPSKENTSYLEQVAILELANEYERERGVTKNLNKKIDEYLLNYASIGVKYGIGNLWTKDDVMSRLDSLSKQNPQEKLDYIKQLPDRNNEEVNRILELIDASDEIKSHVEITRMYVYFRTFRTDILSNAFANSFPLFDEISKRYNLTREMILKCLPNELVNLDIPNKDFIEKRAESIVLKGDQGEIYYIDGEAGLSVYNSIKAYFKSDESDAEKNIEEIKEIKGAIANKGKVQGVVKLVFNNKELNKVNEGDVLVAIMTTPDFVPAMEKAAAFVTDEGGILCHAAIVSREMRKPCIIATQIATKMLKDGMKVEVDADNGVVRILE